MTIEQIFASGLLLLALVLFAWGQFRHDVVAVLVLLLAVLLGLVPAADAFAGFGHPAVITVAAVLILSHALESTGVVGALAQRIALDRASLGLQVAVFCTLGAALSGFINNVGALAMLMPLAIATARRYKLPPSGILMPLSFATMLGGMTTLIGTPPNIIVSSYRAEAVGEPFALFDFFPQGIAIAVLGVTFLTLIGWRLLPRDRTPLQPFEGIDEYLAELHVPDDAAVIGKTAGQIASQLEQRDVQLLGIMRGEIWTPAVSDWTVVEADNVLLVEGAPKALAALQGWEGVSLGPPQTEEEKLRPSDTALAEVVLRPASLPVGLTLQTLRMRSRYRVNLLGVSQQGSRHFGSLKSFRFQTGDVLLLQGRPVDLNDAITAFDAVPLGAREIVVHDRRAGVLAVLAFVAALAAIALGITTPAVALTSAVIALLLMRVLQPRTLYQSLDGAAIVVLGALLPVGESLQSTGVTQLVSSGLVSLSVEQSAYVSLALVLVITMFVSDLINNAATAVVMAPIAVNVAAGLGVSPDPFLMAVAIGASCAFLTPIGHQNNLLVLGPGGYRFGDFWRMGLPLEILIVGLATWILPILWPL